MAITVTDRYKEQSARVGKTPPVVAEVHAFDQFAGIVVGGTGTTIRVIGDATSHFSNGDTVCVFSRSLDTEFVIGSAPVYSAPDDWTSLVLGGFTYDGDEDLYNFVAVKFSLTPYLAKNPISRISQAVESQTLNVFDTGTFKVKLLDPDEDLYNETAQDGFFNTATLVWISVRLGFKGLMAADERPIIAGGIVDHTGTVWKKSSRSLSIQVYGHMKALDHMGAFEASNAYGPMTALTGIELVRYYPPQSGADVIYGPKGLSFRFPDGEAIAGVDIVQIADLDMRTGGRVFKYIHPNRYQWDYGLMGLVQDQDDVNDNGDKRLDDYAGNRAIFNFGRPTSLAKNPNYHTQDIVWVKLEENGTRTFVKGLPTLTFDSGRKAEAVPDFNAVILYDGDANTWTDRTDEASIPGTAFDLLGTNDVLYLGSNERFGGAYFDIQIPATGDFTIGIYYSKGPNNWIEIPAEDYEDGTEGFAVDGWITWQMPSDWRPTTVVDENDPEGDFGWNGLYFVKIVTERSFSNVPEYPELVYRSLFKEDWRDPGAYTWLPAPKAIWADEDHIYLLTTGVNGLYSTVGPHILTIWTNDPPAGHTKVTEFQIGTLGGFNPKKITGDGTYLYIHGSAGSSGSDPLTKAYLKTSPYTYSGEFDASNPPSNYKYHKGLSAGGQDTYDGEDDPILFARMIGTGVTSPVETQIYVTNKAEDTTFAELTNWLPSSFGSNDFLWDIEMGVGEDGDFYAVGKLHYDKMIYKYNWDTETLAWKWGEYVTLPSSLDLENEDTTTVIAVCRQRHPDRGGVLFYVAVAGVHVVLDDNGDSALYYDHLVYESQNPLDCFWSGEYVYVVRSAAECDTVVFGPLTPASAAYSPGTCNRIQKVIGLIGKRGDQLNVLVDIANLPGDSVDQSVIIKHDIDGSNNVIPVPATWYQLMSAHGLMKDLLTRGGYAPSIQHIDDLNLEVDTAQIFGYGGRCPHLTAPHSISSIAYDSATGYLYVASGLEIWRVKSDTEFERVCRVPRPGYTDPVEGGFSGYNYETTWSEKYRIVVLAFVTVSGNATLRGLAIHPHDHMCWSQYTCPAVAFQYDIVDSEFENYTYELKDDDADDYYYGIWPGTHVVRPGRDDHIPGQPSGTYQRMLGQFLSGSDDLKCGENVSLPFGQLVVCGRYKYNGGQHLYTGMQAAAGLCSKGHFYQGLYQFEGRDIGSGFGGARGFPWIYLPPGFYSHWDWFAGTAHNEPCRLRYTFGQEGFLEFDEDDTYIHMAQAVRPESNALGCYLMWQMVSYRIGDDTWHADGPKFLRWHRKGVETQVMCGCLGTDGHRYIGIIQFVEMGWGEGSIAATRIISYKDEGYFFTSAGAPGLQRPGKAYWYNSASGWTDKSADLMSEDTPSYTVELDNTSDYLYLGMKDQFLTLRMGLVAPYVDGTMEIQVWTGSAWEAMQGTGTSEGYNRCYDGTDGLAQSGGIFINPPFDSTDKNRWVASTFYNLTNPGTQSQVPNTAEFYWMRIRMIAISSGTAKIDRAYAEAVVVWDNWRYDSAGHKGYTILNLCDGDSSASNHIIHGALWNRDDGAVTGDLYALQYSYFVLDIDADGISFVTSQLLSDATDTSNSQFMGHVFDPHSDKVYSVMSHPLYRDRGAVFVSATYNGSAITLTRLDDFPAADWGISGKLLATGTGRIYGVTHPRGILFHYDTEVYPRVTIADFGQGMSIRQAITYLCELTNTVFHISPDRQAYVQKRDHAIVGGDILAITEPEHIVKIDEVGTWAHRYDGTHVNWTDIYGDRGTEIAGSSGWEVRSLQISNPFVQDMYVAGAMAQIYQAYFQIVRSVMSVRLVFMPWIELKDIFRLYVSERFGNSSNTDRWCISNLDLDLNKNELDVKALTWDGDES